MGNAAGRTGSVAERGPSKLRYSESAAETAAEQLKRVSLTSLTASAASAAARGSVGAAALSAAMGQSAKALVAQEMARQKSNASTASAASAASAAANSTTATTATAASTAPPNNTPGRARAPHPGVLLMTRPHPPAVVRRHPDDIAAGSYFRAPFKLPGMPPSGKMMEMVMIPAHFVRKIPAGGGKNVEYWSKVPGENKRFYQIPTWLSPVKMEEPAAPPAPEMLQAQAAAYLEECRRQGDVRISSNTQVSQYRRDPRLRDVADRSDPYFIPLPQLQWRPEPGSEQAVRAASPQPQLRYDPRARYNRDSSSSSSSIPS
ncbi:hypothetical protein QBC46DRAFT_385675 [Diplogelasinospora grovesii]|uniref:Uncharacterized protein n=1 Tax=Diplogelasinospora grovesii TaxID=303347 RepID=A0AAN6N7R8_9PEZI|nr:hypothetical protein QBC46DRAFT_385675 [Diplogelasinospora grovesii]